MGNLPTRSGVPIGRGSERQMMSETDVLGFRKRSRVNPDGSVTLLKTRGGFPHFSTSGGSNQGSQSQSISANLIAVVCSDSQRNGIPDADGKVVHRIRRWDSIDFNEVGEPGSRFGFVPWGVIGSNPGVIDWVANSDLGEKGDYSKKPLQITWSFPVPTRCASASQGLMSYGSYTLTDAAWCSALPGYVETPGSNSYPASANNRLYIDQISRLYINGALQNWKPAGSSKLLYGACLTHVLIEGQWVEQLVCLARNVPESNPNSPVSPTPPIEIRRYTKSAGSFPETPDSSANAAIEGQDFGFGVVRYVAFQHAILADRYGEKATAVALMWSGSVIATAVLEIDLQTGACSLPSGFDVGVSTTASSSASNADEIDIMDSPVASDYDPATNDLVWLKVRHELHREYRGWVRDVVGQPNDDPGVWGTIRRRNKHASLIHSSKGVVYSTGSASAGDPTATRSHPGTDRHQNDNIPISFSSSTSDHEISVQAGDLRAGVYAIRVYRTQELGDASLFYSGALTTTEHKTLAVKSVIVANEAVAEQGYFQHIEDVSDSLSGATMSFVTGVSVSGNNYSNPNYPSGIETRNYGIFAALSRLTQFAATYSDSARHPFIVPRNAAVARSPDGKVVFVEMIDPPSDFSFRSVMRDNDGVLTWANVINDIADGDNDAVHWPVFMPKKGAAR